MKKAIRGPRNSQKQRGPGRPKTTGSGTQIGMRWLAADLAAIDDWRRWQTDLPPRSEAIRRLVKLALAGKQINTKPNR
jgi:hypothetical protein